MLERALPFLKLAIAAAIVMLAGLVWSQRGTIEAQDAAISTLQDHAAKVAKQLKDLSDNQVKADKNSLAIQTAQDKLRAALGQREIDIRSLQNDFEEIRGWAGQQLPGPIVRLRQRPALTGSAAYSEYLSNNQPMHTIGQQPADKRRPQSPAGTGGK